MLQADINTRVRERLDETLGTSSQRFTTADLTEYSLDGARFYIAAAGSQYATTTITGVAYQQLYDLPCDFIQVERVLWNDGTDYIPVEPTDFRTMDESYYQWQHVTSTRARCYYRFSTRRLGLWPMPTVAGEDYLVHYQQDVGSDISKVALEDHECLVDYVLARCLLTEGKAKDGIVLYGAYKAVVDAAKRRRGSMDRMWSMGRLPVRG